MGRVVAIGLSLAVFVLGSTSIAHPGPKILTAGGTKERAAMTSGMKYEDVNGVHIFRGSTKLAGGEKIIMRRAMTKIKLEMAAPRCAYRSCRRLRTQGFYSGKKYKSRRYTQGFYSGQ